MSIEKRIMNNEVQVSAELNVSYDNVPAIPIGFP